MAPRRRRRRPWHRTRAYRLARTVALTVTLVTSGVWWARDEEPPDAVTAASAVPAGVTGAAAEGAATDGRAPAPAAGPPDWPGPVGQLRATPPKPAPPEPTSRKPASPGPASPGPASPGAARAEPAPRGTAHPARPPRPSHASPPAKPPAASGAPRTPPERPGPKPPGARAATPGPSASAHPHPAPAKGPRTLPPSRATRILIPYLELDAPLTQLRLDEKRRLPAPPADKPKLAGWYADGPAPGAPGTAVAVGHLDTDSGPAVFAGLSQLKPGRRIEVRRADGRTAVYTVDALKKYEKSDFPNQEVYGARDRPELRLITCGGAYDRRSGYSGNLVVFAHLTRTT